MNRFLLYIDILGFKELVKNNSAKVEQVYKIIDSLNAHRHEGFKTIIFSDTILVYNKEKSRNWGEHDYYVMYACEFVQDLQFRLTGQNIFFRAVLVSGKFNHYHLENSECFFGEALIKAYTLEKNIQAVGLFIDDYSMGHNRVFPTKRFDKDLSFVYLHQSLERLQKDTGGNLPQPSSFFCEMESYPHLLNDLMYLSSIYRAVKKETSSYIRNKHLMTWYLYQSRYPKILNAMQDNEFSPKIFSEEYDWSSLIDDYKSNIKYFNDMRNA